MNLKEVKFNEDAKLPLIKGINTVCDAVSSTMGYRGRTVLIESSGGLPIVTKDGVTVAKNVFLEDPIESLGCEFIKQACEKTVSEAGDATTQTAVLAKSIISLSNECLSVDNISPISIKNNLEESVKMLIDALKEDSIEVDDEILFNVAKISANNDDELGGIISEAFLKVGKNGIVSHEKSETSETYLEFIDGMPIDSGWDFEGFVNVPTKRVVEFNNEPLILLSNKKINTIKELLPILEYINKYQKELLIVSDMEYDVLKTLYANKKSGSLKIAVVSPPSIGEKRRDYLTDINLAIGGLVVDVDTNNNIDMYHPEELLGTCSKLVVTKEDTILFFDNEKFASENKKLVESRIEELNNVIKNSNNKLEIEYLQKRVSKLACGVSVVKVGGNTQVEINEKIDRVDDAIHAVKSAISEGIVIGGGLALAKAHEKIKEVQYGYDEYNILDGVVKSPFYTILSNAGVDKIDSIYKKIMSYTEEDSYWVGYDVKNYNTTHMLKQGIVDPVRAVKCALQNALSVSNTVLTTNTTITHLRSK
jgi:chaperonin GroEL